MSEIQFNPNLKPSNALELSDEQLAKLAKKRAYLQQQGSVIIKMAQLPNTALTCLHKINVLGGATEKTYAAINERIIADNDAYGAYHAIAMAQTTSDLPFDVPAMIAIIQQHGDIALAFRLLKLFYNQPLNAKPVNQIITHIQQSQNRQIIAQLNAYLANYEA
ncbi:hypothetical protein MOMA_08981 [Moraxella macacae 0408225]|uniref:Uncharacterized protein n=1 Tax=Moraxella macacae 0408225 TaxID=1230338 RepID=L2F708_9GAMM|nr:hypothetical protein [Moraxella macacae]ELA08680.1 hypothetical protein MOMA_08981 [Moraxella macacae 0408225]